MSLDKSAWQTRIWVVYFPAGMEDYSVGILLFARVFLFFVYPAYWVTAIVITTASTFIILCQGLCKRVGWRTWSSVQLKYKPIHQIKSHLIFTHLF